eukprot:CAMPEP_0182475658 /NCGR_PEP_ID=MMETSP1319-20130603/27732_1 /TAXON_ID=172717 /ORGANISM="Bolidomonas pacifica, Strain RCC208" /LENGTH=143 /DNA_ID=CAMNT_0024676671 /DNA_START=8 /DNA_END=436 /DNA_ORIENTATION=-
MKGITLKVKAKKSLVAVSTFEDPSVGSGALPSSTSSSSASKQPLVIPPVAPAPNATFEHARQLAAAAAGGSSNGPQSIALAPTASNPLLAHHDPTISDADKYKRHLDSCPDEAGVDDECYAAVSVDDFGAAMLRGMGWDPAKD